VDKRDEQARPLHHRLGYGHKPLLSFLAKLEKQHKKRLLCFIQSSSS